MSWSVEDSPHLTSTQADSTISSTEVERYVDDGFLVVENLVGEEDRTAVLAEVERFARGEYNTLGLPGSSHPPVRHQDILAIHFPHWVSPTLRSMILHPRVVDVVRHIAAAHLAHWDGRAKCMQSMLFVKPPGMPGQAWHQDERFIPTRDRSLVGAWIALDDATVENGCVWVLPGSHRMGYLWPTRRHDSSEFDPSDESYGFDATGAVPVEVRAGSVIFFNGYLLHRSLRNQSASKRRALVNHYCNAWSLLPWSIPPISVSSSEIPTLDYRCVVPVGDDPYQDRGYGEEPDWVFLRPYDARSEPSPEGSSPSEDPTEVDHAG
jgi:ectoine hydroxylase-related dioxygenase (phytanoyl-CoA dioxygenase family)